MSTNTPISNEEKHKYDQMVEAISGQYANATVALMRVDYKGDDAAAVVIVSEDPDSDEVYTTPVALLVTDAMFEHLTPPSAEMVEVDAEE